MQKLLLSIVFALTVLGSAYSQSPGCANIIAPADFTLPCAAPCTTLTAVPFHVGSTSTYTVASIPHAPVIPYASAGGTVVSAGTDDVYSPLITLPFPFCFYGNTYTQCKVGSNGNIQFGAAGGGFCPWSFTANCPSATLPLNSIFGVFHDVDPSVCGSIKWFLTGTSPCRMLVVNFNTVCHFSCTSITSTHQIVLYETTNVIEVHIGAKPTCAGWNGGRAIVGIQNATGTVGLAAPGRNSTPTWTATNEAWRFTPNGAPIYTVSWFQGATLLATGTNSVTVCPTATTTYTASVTYTRCDGLIITDTDPITITISNLPAPTVTPVAETCAGYNNGSVTINNAAGPGPFTVTIAGPTSGSVVEPNTAAGVANFTGLPDGVYTYTVTSAAGCTFTGTFTINPGPPCCSVTAAGVNPLCNGGTTGTVTASPTGLPGYSYSWTTAPIQTTQTATGLGAGTYTVTMTDASGCVATANVTITQPTAITGTLTPVNPLCNGGSTGSITVTGAAGGTGAFQYSLNGGPFQVSNVFTGLPAGPYTVVIRDANNCTTTLTITLTNPPVVTSALVSTTPATCGVSNGAITVSGGGGTGVLSYNLNPGPVNATGVFTGLASGTYSVIVTDANGCTSTVSGIVVGSSAGPTASILSSSNVSCFGGVNGSVLIGATGGTAPITYTIDLAGPTAPVGPQASNSFINLVAGTYAVTVTDGNGCIGTTSFTITSPPQLTYTSTFTPATCNGVCDGTITVTPAGGTPGYTYSSNNGLTFGAANPMTGLCAGNIFVVVRDANGCLANSLVVMTQPAAITATFTPTNPICQGICNGQIAVTGTAGGAGGYTYSINGGAFAALPTTFTGLCSGANTIVINDANGCALTNVQNLVDPPGYTITIVDTQESNCGFNNGSLEVLASGGAAPYSYNNVTLGLIQPTGLFGSITAGGYDIQVTDANGCIEQLFVGVNDVEMDGILDGLTPATCFGDCDGTVQTSAINGAAPIQYELDLSGSFFLTGNFTGLCAGSHIVTIVDNGFCIFTIPFNIVEPPAVTFNTAVVDVACSGGSTGSITFNTVAGGNGVYTYSIDGGATYQASTIFTGLAAGTYTLSVMDGNGCLGSGTATIIQAPALSYVANTTDLTCFGNSSGFLQVVAAGGTGAITYQANALAVKPNSVPYLGLPAGVYNVVVTDAAGCTITGVETINEPTPLVAAYVITPATCNGVCDGVIDVTAAGATPTYQYSDDNGITYQISSSLTGLCDGSYQVMIKDANGCIIGSTQTVTEPTLITYVVAVTPSTCGNSNGTITVNGTAGGTPGYTYSIDNGVTFVASPVFPGLAAGTYDVVVEDANGCQIATTATILNQASPFITSASVTDVNCNAACDGTLSGSAVGGTGALSFDIGGIAQASANFTAICAGAYTFTVTDANGCTDTQVFTVVEPTALTMAQSGVNLLCFNDNSGSVSIVAGGGVTPYLYSYDGGTSFTTVTTEVNLGAGTYNLIIQDANGCQVTGTQALTEPTAITITSQPQTNISCFGVCDGVATVNITGGTVAGLYNYNWAGSVAGPTQNSASGLCAGSYPVTISDDNGCNISTTFTLTQPPQVIIVSFSAADATCFGTCNGTIDIVAINAVLYSIDNGATFQASPNFTGLCAGTYGIVVQDAAGCTTTSSATVNEPSALVQNAIADITICYGGFGTLNASASGGTPPYTFTWNTGAISQFYSITDSLPNTYTCTVTDLNGCVSAPQSANVSILPKFNASVLSVTDTICPGAQANFSASGIDGVPTYTYWWYDAAGNPLDTITGSPTFTTANLSTPANFTLVAFDQCPTYETINLSVIFYPLPTPTFTSPDADGCAPLTVTFISTTPAAMTNGTCTWDFGDGNTGTGCIFTTNTYANSGQYSVTLTTTSLDGCTNDSTFVNFVTVYPDPIPDFTYLPVGPTILEPDVDFTNLTVGGSTYTWDFAGLDTSNVIHPSYSFAGLDGGDYIICLTAVSANGCVADTCKPLTLYDELLIYVPNSFTPDGDGTNDIFLPSVKGALDEGYQFLVFNRWGEIIFQTDSKLNGWDGTHNSQKSKEDVYVWKLKAKNNRNGDVKEYVGHVTLLR